jgi:hypothetical protein
MSRTIERIRPSVLITLCIALLVSVAAAQIDDRARELLEGIQPAQGETVDTLQQVMVMTLHQQGDMEVRTRTVIDYVNERAAIETEISPGMVATIIVADGQVRMAMGGMSLPLPAAIGDEFADMFDADPNDPLAGIESATYDGVQSYGDLAEGEQVTVRGAVAVAGVDDSEVARYLFDGQGRLVAVVVDTSDGVILSVFDEPVTGSTAVGSNATMYLETAGGYERFATMRFEQVLVNEPIPDGTF